MRHSVKRLYLFLFLCTSFLHSSGEIYGDHGLLSHLTPFNVTQGVVRNRKAIFNVPLSLEVAADVKKMQFDVTFVNPKGESLDAKRSVRRHLIHFCDFSDESVGNQLVGANDSHYATVVGGFCGVS